MGAQPEPSGHCEPLLIVAAIDIARVVFPEPPAPAKIKSRPTGIHFSQSQRVGVGGMSAASRSSALYGAHMLLLTIVKVLPAR